MAQVNVSTVINAYVQLRDKRSALKQKYETLDGELRGKMDKLEAYLLGVMQEQEATQLGSEFGTAYKQVTIKASCSDWPSFWSFQQETGRFDMTQKRLSEKAIQTYLEETGELPPGVNTSSELKIIVRRS